MLCVWDVWIVKTWLRQLGYIETDAKARDTEYGFSIIRVVQIFLTVNRHRIETGFSEHIGQMNLELQNLFL